MRLPSLVTIAALACALPALAEDPAAGAFDDEPVMVPELDRGADGGITAPVQSSPFTAGEREALHAEIRTYLLANPEVLMEMLQILEQKKQATEATTDQQLVAAEPRRRSSTTASPGSAAIPRASVTIVEFLDYQCGYCRKAQPEVDEAARRATATSG